jgi:hypothetical protein
MLFKTLLTVSIAALAATYLYAAAQASPLSPGRLTSSNVQQVAGKSAPGRCGLHMYWSAKDHKCMDARSKSKSNWRPF